jgi:short subunit fatty acids transporter
MKIWMFRYSQLWVRILGQNQTVFNSYTLCVLVVVEVVEQAVLMVQVPQKWVVAEVEEEPLLKKCSVHRIYHQQYQLTLVLQALQVHQVVRVTVVVTEVLEVTQLLGQELQQHI